MVEKIWTTDVQNAKFSANYRKSSRCTKELDSSLNVFFSKEALLMSGLLVSTYVVCERLSVMHEPAGVVENLVQILQFTPILQNRIPPPRKLSEILAL